MIKTAEKKCPVCEKTKPQSEYYKAKTRPDGMSWNCKECIRDYDGGRSGAKLPGGFWTQGGHMEAAEKESMKSMMSLATIQIEAERVFKETNVDDDGQMVLAQIKNARAIMAKARFYVRQACLVAGINNLNKEEKECDPGTSL